MRNGPGSLPRPPHRTPQLGTGTEDRRPPGDLGTLGFPTVSQRPRLRRLPSRPLPVFSQPCSLCVRPDVHPRCPCRRDAGHCLGATLLRDHIPTHHIRKDPVSKRGPVHGTRVTTCTRLFGGTQLHPLQGLSSRVILPGLESPCHLPRSPWSPGHTASPRSLSWCVLWSCCLQVRQVLCPRHRSRPWARRRPWGVYSPVGGTDNEQDLRHAGFAMVGLMGTVAGGGQDGWGTGRTRGARFQRLS